MRCLDHVFLRGAMAVALLASGGTGALLLPQPSMPPACSAERVPIARPLASADGPHAAPAQRAAALARQAPC